MRPPVILEGLHALKHAHRFGARITQVWSDDLDKALNAAESIDPALIPWLQTNLKLVSRTVFREHASQPVPTHVLAWAEPPAWTLTQSLPTAEQPTIVLDDPRNSKNLGAVIRVGAAAGASGVLVNGAADPFSPMAVRGAAGLQWALPCWGSAGLMDELAAAGSATPTLVGLDADGDRFDPAEFSGPVVFAFGSERTGLSPEVRARCDHIVALPMRPAVSSLNLATCVSAVLYLRLYA